MRLIYFLAALLMMCSVTHVAFAKKKHRLKHHGHAHRYSTSHISLSPAVQPVLYGAPQLSERLNQIIHPEEARADIAVYVKSMDHGDALYAHHVDQALTPASTLKVLTAGAALIYLGPDYRFSTQLLTDAKTIKNGTLQGNLYIVLSGDPSLTYDELVDLMLSLKSQKIQAIAGNVYIDMTAYDQHFYGPGWSPKDKQYCYGAPISASIINHNCLSFQVAPGKISGQAAHVVTSSKYFYPRMTNSVITKSTHGRSCSLRLRTGTNSTVSIEGCVGKGHGAWGVSYVIADVPEYNRALFKGLLNRLLINVRGNVTFGPASTGLSLINGHQSKPLELLISDMLKKSDNIIAEALFKKLGQLYTGRPGSWENGRLAVSQILSKHTGMNERGLQILDGSGLSPNNLVAPEQMMQVLNFAYHHSISNAFISALPIAGIDGTLKHRMGNIAHKVHAKTGTISGVVSLAGYAESGDNEQLAFVIMVNGNKGMGWRYKAMEDKIMTALTRYKRSG